jgi:hypothetical protein
MQKSNSGWQQWLDVHRPVLIVVATVVVVVAAYTAWTIYQRRALNVNVVVVDPTKTEATSWEEIGKKSQPVVVQSRAVYVEAERLRSATALAWGLLAIFVTQNTASVQQGKYVVYDGPSAVAMFERLQLTPPGVRYMGQGGWCETENGKLEIRIRMQPVLLEVLSEGKGATDGDAFLIQLAGSDSEPKLWRAPKGAAYVGVGVRPTQLLDQGWKAEPFRHSPLDAMQTAEVMRWIQSQQLK